MKMLKPNQCWFLFLVMLLFVSSFSMTPHLVLATDSIADCLYISELMPDPVGDDDKLEYIEICNACNSTFNTSELFISIKDKNYSISGKIIEANSSLLIVKSCSSSEDICGKLNLSNESDDVFCCYSNNLVNGGSNVSLFLLNNSNESNQSFFLVDFFEYNSSKEGYAYVRNSNGSFIEIKGGNPGACIFGNSSEIDDSISSDNNIEENESSNNETSSNDENPDSDEEPSEEDTSENDASEEGENPEEYEKDYIYIKAPLIIDETSVSYRIGLFQYDSSEYSTDDFEYVYWVEDFCGNILRDKRTSSSFSDKSFTPRTNCCAYSINAKLIAPYESEIVSQILIKPQDCIEGYEAIETLEQNLEELCNESNSNETNSSSDSSEECEDDFIYIKAPQIINETSVAYEIRLFKQDCSEYSIDDFEYIYWVEDFCGNILRDKRISSSFGDKSFTPRTDCCAYSINAKLIAPYESDIVSKVLIKPSSCMNYENMKEELSMMEMQLKEKEELIEEFSNQRILNSGEFIRSFYTLKEYFEPNISFYANLDLTYLNSSEPRLFIAEESFEANDGKNEIVLNLSKPEGRLLLVLVNDSDLLDYRFLNYSFEYNQNQQTSEGHGLNSLTAPSKNNKSVEANIENVSESSNIQGAYVYLSSDSSSEEIYPFILPASIGIVATIYVYQRKNSKKGRRKAAISS
ncbi:MAG: hypothetical protein PWQ87_306 [Candidatus Woesearchaeota archaeon]|nr:hypothetical protein [Candidatus Woesearchaeota archaeon]